MKMLLKILLGLILLVVVLYFLGVIRVIDKEADDEGAAGIIQGAAR